MGQGQIAWTIKMVSEPRRMYTKAFSITPLTKNVSPAKEEGFPNRGG